MVRYLFLLRFILFYMCECFACTYKGTLYECLGPVESEEGFGSPEAGVWLLLSFIRRRENQGMFYREMYSAVGGVPLWGSC